MRHLVERARAIVLAIHDPVGPFCRERRRQIKRLLPTADQHGSKVHVEAIAEDAFQIGRFEVHPGRLA